MQLPTDMLDTHKYLNRIKTAAMIFRSPNVFLLFFIFPGELPPITFDPQFGQKVQLSLIGDPHLPQYINRSP
jgi:hypothetical protein